MPLHVVDLYPIQLNTVFFEGDPLVSHQPYSFGFRRWLLSLLCLSLLPMCAFGHGVAGADQAFLEQNSGRSLLLFTYLGAKHMVTGYDHLLFLFGVVFFLYRMRDVSIYVTLFAVGHSMTLLFGVLGGFTLALTLSTQ
jgi:hypothetical protein